ncbi:MAG: hypothetical protein FJ109_14455 [Deltaproteobacteria bacterium]|nr:hypothetical protein [Deltaproteobacteria bacterium]
METRLTLLFATAVCLCACSGSPSGAGDVRDAEDSVAGDVLPRDSFDAASLCPTDVPLSERVPLLPQPFAVYRWGEPVALNGTRLEVIGPGEDAAAELDALAEAAGLRQGGNGEGDVAVRIQLHDEADWAALQTVCSLDAGVIPGAYFLDVEVKGTTLVVHLLAGEETGRFYGLKTLRQVMGAGLAGLPDVRPGREERGGGGQDATESSPASGRSVRIFDRPAIAMRGLIEGFYGTPWGPKARLDMVALAGELRLSHYLYAPKAAPLINTAWMLPFEQDDLAHFEALAEAGRRHHVRICLEMHPSWLFHYSSDEDMAVLLGKFEAAVAQGIDCLALAYDDVSDKLIPPDDQAFADYTAAQADFVPRLGEALRAAHPDVALVYVPVEYYTNHPRAATAWPVFAAALPDYWEIAWTGREIGNTAISLADAEEAAGMMQRKPLLGDNYPVSDDANKTGVLFLGPLVGRSPDLLQGLSGIAFNAMPLPYSSLPAVATAADYSWNPQRYVPAESMRSASRLLGGKEGADALYTLAMANRCAMLEGSAAPELAEAVAELWESIEAKDAPDAAALALREQFFVPYRSVQDGLASEGVLPGLAAELVPWTSKLTAYGKAGELALDLLLEQAGGKVTAPGKVQDLADQAEALEALLPKPTGKIMDEFLDRVLLELEGK